jgi:tricorn protease
MLKLISCLSIIICLFNTNYFAFSQQKKLTKKEKEILRNADLIVDVQGIEDRIFALPVKTAKYFNLTTADSKLYYVRKLDGKNILFSFDFEKMEEKEIGEYTNFAITPDAKNVMFQHGKNEYYLNKLTEKFNTKDGKLDITSLKTNLNRKEEWQQIFNESWRHYKQFFYAPNMHGVD